MLSPNLDPWLCTHPVYIHGYVHVPSKRVSQLLRKNIYKTIRKPVKLLVKSDFTSNLRSLRACIPPNNPSLYVHMPPNNPSVHPWLCTRPSKQPQRTIMAMYTSRDNILSLIRASKRVSHLLHTIARKYIKRSRSSQYDCSWS